MASHAVRRRTQEVGICLALGGLPRDVLARLLFGFSSADPFVYLGISALLPAVARRRVLDPGPPGGPDRPR